MFHDGIKWRAAIDFHGTGDLTEAPLLTNYHDELQYTCVDQDTMLNVCVNIYDEGETLSIVTLAGSHGTHVAAISAACYPDQPEINGVAPGAQIVSLKIGDTRLGSMETGTGLVRAAIELARLKVDVANMSYGEATSLPEFGKFLEILKRDVINQNGCVFVASGGNNGPALSTVGAPGGTSSGIIGVGAYVTKSMMAAEYALLEQVNERPYTWSSRGPSPDGDVGVDVYAPGAAITSVPQYTIKNSQLMNGTSMSSPNCAGCVALLISGLKKQNISYNPYAIKRALQVTGKSVDDPFGIKMVQVDDAWNYLSKSIVGSLAHSLSYKIDLPSHDHAQGIYLRSWYETNYLQELTVSVEPYFPQDKETTQNAKKLAFEVQLTLSCEASWVRHPEYIHLNNDTKSFAVRVDPVDLAPGLHFAQVHAIDAQNPSLGPLFTIPVTVCKAQSNVPDAFVTFAEQSFIPGDIKRFFLDVPANANFIGNFINGRIESLF